jgi:hypothetical protein
MGGVMLSSIYFWVFGRGESSSRGESESLTSGVQSGVRSLQDLVLEEIAEAEERVEAKTRELHSYFTRREAELERRASQVETALAEFEGRVAEWSEPFDVLARHNLDYNQVVELSDPEGSSEPEWKGEGPFRFTYREYLFERTLPLEGHVVAYIVSGFEDEEDSEVSRLRNLWDTAPPSFITGGDSSSIQIGSEVPVSVPRRIYIGRDALMPWMSMRDHVRWADTFEEVPTSIRSGVEALVLNLARMKVIPPTRRINARRLRQWVGD